MVYANTDNYIEWLGGRAEVIPLSEFPFWSNRASAEIDLTTFNRLKDPATFEAHSEAVMRATCAIAEIIFNSESPNRKKELSGYSIGGYSESYVSGEAKTPQERISASIRCGLALTGLLSRAV